MAQQMLSFPELLNASEEKYAGSKQKLPTQLSSTTIRRPCFYYIWLKALTSQGLAREVDKITVRSHYTEALTAFLGVTGASIAMDILKCERGDVFLRIPYEDSRAVVEALNCGKEGWRIKGSSTWLGGLSMGTSGDVFR